MMRRVRNVIAVAALVGASSACTAPAESAAAESASDGAAGRAAADAEARGFRLVVPSSITLPSDGSSTRLPIAVVRNGRPGPIAVKLVGLAPDLRLSIPSSIPARSSEITAKLSSRRPCVSTTAKVRVETASGEIAEATFGIEVGAAGHAFGSIVGCPGRVETTQVGSGSLVEAGAGRFFLLSGDCEIGRYRTADASLDTTFGVNGTVTVPDVDACTSLQRLTDGRLLASGTKAGAATPLPRLVRLTAAGSPDGSFGDAGMLTLAPGTAWTRDASDRLVVAVKGPAREGTTVVVRYDRDGHRDATFAVAELMNVATEPHLAANDDGVFLAWRRDETTEQGVPASSVILHKLLPGGGTDAGFGTDGEMVVPSYASGSSTERFHLDAPSWIRVMPSGSLILATEAAGEGGAALVRVEAPTEGIRAWSTRLVVRGSSIGNATEEPSGTFLVSFFSTSPGGPGTYWLYRIDASGNNFTSSADASADDSHSLNWVSAGGFRSTFLTAGDGTALVPGATPSGVATITRISID